MIEYSEKTLDPPRYIKDNLYAKKCINWAFCIAIDL